MAQHDQLHLQARLAAVEAYFSSSGDMGRAVTAFASWNASHPQHQIVDVRNFIKRSVDKLRTHFTLCDLTGGGQALQAAA